MKSLFRALVVLLSLLQLNQTEAQIKPTVVDRPWNSKWIAEAHDRGVNYGVYEFRKQINLTAKPQSFVVYVSADNRYKLYVNGTLVSLGPARCDTYFWNYETVDLAPYLVAGKNEVSALVYNEAEYRPAAQITVRTAFIVQGQTPAEDILNTDNTWKCTRDYGREPIPGFFFAASKGELVDINRMTKGDWTALNYDDSDWQPAVTVMDGRLKGQSWGIDWALVPSKLPAREMTYQRILKVRAADIQVPAGFPEKQTALTVPANTNATLLLDQTFETNAYITLNFSHGKGGSVVLGYAETLYDKGSHGSRKSNRNDVEGKEFVGRIDSVMSDGSDVQKFTTLNFRTFRYILLKVHTGSDPLVINDLYGTFTAYPFIRVSKFNTDNASNAEINQMLDIGWRTARLNAWETYTDCPYYEQLQYIGDTRIQALISYYNTNDDRLAKNALTLMDHSRLAEGVTKSCYPTMGTQIISTFSLWYICMLHDYWMYRNDPAFVKDKLTGERAVLDFFTKYQQPDGSLKDMPYWAFVDWAGNLAGEVKGTDGSAAIYDLQLLLAYQAASEMESKIGMAGFATLYQAKAAQLKATIWKKYWNPQRKLFADTREQTGYSQHVNALAILAGIVNKADMPALTHALLTDKTLTQCTVYFKYYLNQALVKAGLGNDYMSWLDIWRENISMGLTTWAEDSSLKTVRSDCHAWGASPNIEFFRTVLGVESDAPGFRKVRIEPHLGDMRNASGEIPHPDGIIMVDYKAENGKWRINITIPGKTTGTLIWKAKPYLLKPGKNSFVI